MMSFGHIALDTNVLVRVFVNDPDNIHQNDLARKLINQYEWIYISQIVQVELVWVLDRRYKFHKNEIIKLLETLANHQGFILENKERFLNALMLYKNNHADFSDYLIYQYAQDNECQFFSFDKNLLKSKNITILSP